MGYSDADIEYLRKYGEWQDIPLIIKSLDRPEIGRTASLLLAPDTGKYRIAARSIYALGRTRFEELLTLEAQGALLTHLIVESSDKVFHP